MPAVHFGRLVAVVTRTTEEGMGAMNGENSTVHGPIDRDAVTASRIDSQLSNGVKHETTASRTVTFHMSVDTAAWAQAYGLEPNQVQASVAEWLDNATHCLGLPSDAVGDIVAVPARLPVAPMGREVIELAGNELRALLRDVIGRGDTIQAMRFDPRDGGMAFMFNNEEWTPAVGHTVETHR